MKDIDGGISTIQGVRAWGVKQGKHGLAVITARGSAAGVFTRNRVIAAPLILTKQHIEVGRLSALVVNSGNANAFTGASGLHDANRMAELTAARMGLKKNEVGVASTGVIGRRLDMELIKSQLDEVIKNLTTEYEGSAKAARAIMTTDTFPKEVAVEMSNGSRIGGIAKGSGMIEPNMGTMLAFIYTDADFDNATLDQCLHTSVNKSFNMVVVDGDTSTNDMALLIATGQSGRPDIQEFQQSLDYVCIRLAKMIAKDGEGASHLIEAKVTGAKDEKDAVLAAKAIVRSPLVKSAIFGKDPNWGRVIAAVGYSGADVDQDMISLDFSNSDTLVKLVENGKINDISEDQLKYVMESEEIVIHINIGLGIGSAAAWGCDLTYDYVRINAEYTT